MSASRKRKKAKKQIHFELSRLALVGWCSGLLLALLWMFVLGIFVGKGITPANINFTEIKKRMIAEGVWPGSGKLEQQEASAPSTNTKRKIPLKDLEFYEKLAKKKKARLQEPTVLKSPPKERPPTTVAAKSPPPPQQQNKLPEQQKSSTASFKDLNSAKKFAARFKDLKPKVIIREVDLASKGRWYRVQVGRLESREKASELANRLAKKYQLQAFVIGL
jgi:cell division septation protein DedD